MSNKESTFSAKGLIKAYSGRKVVNNVSLRLAQGQIVGTSWPNGQENNFVLYDGRLVRADEGQIILNGRDITKEPIHQRALRG